MKKDNLLSILLGRAALLLMATTALGVTSCSQDNEEPGGTLPEGKITLVPTVAPVTAWNAGDNAPDTRADATIAASLTGGKIGIDISTLGADGNSAGQKIGCNYYSVSADGKLTRLPYDSGNLDETEADLAVDAPGDYWMYSGGTVTLTTDGIEYSGSFVRNEGAKTTIAADGKFSIALSICAGGLRLNVKNTDGTDYTGTDVTAKPLTITPDQYGASFEVKTFTSTVHSAIWGDISSSSSVNKGDPLLELATGGKTYRVLAPRQISFTAARLYTFNVRVGATGITVSSDDLGIADFEAVVVTNAEAEPVPLYNGAIPNSLAISGQTAYWVAPVDANADITWINIDFDAICPAGWHVPTKDEFVAMTGIQDSDPHSENNDAIKAAFSVGTYWSFTELEGGAGAYYLNVSDDASDISGYTKGASYHVRCVRKK